MILRGPQIVKEKTYVVIVICKLVTSPPITERFKSNILFYISISSSMHSVFSPLLLKKPIMIHSLLDINMAEIKPVLTNLPIDSNLKQLKKSHRLHKMTSYSSFHALLLTLYDYFKRNLLNEDNNINNTMISLIIHAGCERSDHPHYRVMNLFSCEACLPST